jgi:hypothetical protein
MNQTKLISSVCTSSLLAVLVALPRVAEAGLPLICQPLEIGGAKSLPWGMDLGNLSGKRDYNLVRLAGDTLDLLAPSTPVIVRMETLRRAAIYGQKDSQAVEELFRRLQDRAMKAEANDHPDALALFDLGYFIECLKQANWDYKKLPSGSWHQIANPNAAANFEGLPWVQKAIRLRGEDAEMEFAAALITSYPHQQSHDDHLRRAVAGAKEGSLLAKNLILRYRDRGNTVAALRAMLENAK